MDLGEAVRHWETHGYVVLPGYLSMDELAPARAELGLVYPTAQEFHDGVDEKRNSALRGEFGGIRKLPFPSVELSLLAVHPRLVEFAEAVLGTDDIRLYTAESWAKYTGAGDYRQAHHRDYFNHTPLVPSRDPRFRQLEMFLYLHDVTPEHGPTHVVSRTLTDHLPAMPHWYLPDERPELYDNEVAAAGPAGTLLAYSVDTFHRGTAMRAERAARFTLMANFRAAANEWMTRHSWGDQSFEPDWYPFVERATPRQLLLFGFPPPGHAFWTEETLTAMAVRYPTLDLAPWRAPGWSIDGGASPGRVRR